MHGDDLMSVGRRSMQRPASMGLALIFALALVACGPATDDTAVGLIGQSAPSIRLDISAREVVQGGSVTLTWSSHQASACIASGGWSGSRPSQGRETIVGIVEDKAFSLSCSSPAGVIRSVAEVRVVQQDPVTPSLYFAGSASQISPGSAVTLSWEAVHSSGCIASGSWSGVKGIQGSQTIDNIQQDSLFVLECNGAGTSVSQTVSVDVVPASPVLPTLTLQSSASSVSSGGSVNLSWISTDADVCTATGGWSGNKTQTGLETISNLTANTRFSLTCSGAGGSVTRHVDVVVTANPAGGSTALLSWVSPTENTDNSPLLDLAGFKIYYGTAPGNHASVIDVASPGATQYRVENLPRGTWYFVVTAYNALGLESVPSNEVSKVIP